MMPYSGKWLTPIPKTNDKSTTTNKHISKLSLFYSPSRLVLSAAPELFRKSGEFRTIFDAQ